MKQSYIVWSDRMVVMPKIYFNISDAEKTKENLKKTYQSIDFFVCKIVDNQSDLF